MATSREERMQQRMRGAHRHQVEDASFGPIFPVEEEEEEEEEEEAPAPATSPAAQTTPNTSAKRRRLEGDDAPTAAPQVHSAPLVPSQPRQTSIQSPHHSPERGEQGSVRSQLSPVMRRVGRGQAALEQPPRSTPRRFARNPDHLVEEVGESPANAPGSGQRRTVRISAAANQSALLQQLVAAADNDEDPVQTSPPTRKSGKSARTVPTRSSGRAGAKHPARLSSDADEVDELSPLPPVGGKTSAHPSSPAAQASRKSSSAKSASSQRSSTRRRVRISVGQGAPDELSPASLPDVSELVASSSPLVRRQRRSDNPAATAGSAKVPRRRSLRHSEVDAQVDELSPEQPAQSRREDDVEARQPGLRKRAISRRKAPVPQEVVEEEDAAEEIDAHEATRRIGRKRPLASPREPSPELGSQPLSEQEPVSKRRRKQAKDSPAKQKQPRKQKAKVKAQEKDPARARKPKEDSGAPVAVTVQRFTKRIQYEEDDTDADILNADIPYANRGSVNVIDALSQMCEELIDANLNAIHEAAIRAEDTTTKREFRTKLRALEAFQEELRSRLLEHTIALDSLHALKKRVRVAQKEKLSLRDEILRIRAERGQVATRMDAVRIQHEAESKEALHHINLSSAMHDIELAIEQGQAAPDPSPAEQKVADLANLELLVSRVADQACSRSSAGGALKQIKDFNAFLERAAAVLEGG